MKKNVFLRLTESSVMLAFAVVLSMIKLIDLPYGGSVTACSMLPIVVIAYRYGFRWGLFTSVTYAGIQLLLGASILSYATSALAAVLIIVLDYLLAFGGFSIAGVFSKKNISQSTALWLSVVLSGIFRYACHVISGYVVWRDISIPEAQALVYSFSYNAVYMLPEIIVTSIAAVYISDILNFSGEKLTFAQPKGEQGLGRIPFLLGTLILAVMAVVQVVTIFPYLQNESGSFDITGIKNINLPLFFSVLICGVTASIIFFIIGKIRRKKLAK